MRRVLDGGIARARCLTHASSLRKAIASMVAWVVLEAVFLLLFEGVSRG
jgi:hypothetical protein